MCFSDADCKVLINDRAHFFVTHTCNKGKVLHGLAAKSRATCRIFRRYYDGRHGGRPRIWSLVRDFKKNG